jgi:ABC-type transport system involved in cytochrome bd biosynthesis fused ATPase/permease subunit
MNTIKNQHGMSTLGMMTVALLIVFGAVTAMKLWSPYYDDLAVKTAVENMSKEESTRAMTPNEILQTLNKRLQVNQVTLNKDDVKVKKEDGIIKIDVVYERRIPMYGNIDAMVKFNHHATINARGS